MKSKKILSAIVLIAGFFSHAQNVKGYYITEAGNRTDGYFKQANFFNESNLYFETSESDAEYTHISADEIKEYSAGTDVKFQKFTVNIDDTNLNGTGVGYKKNAVYVQRTIFLNVIVEGDATLYSYSSDKGLKFFYKVDSKGIPVTQLLYKKYYRSQSDIAENSMYKQQLFNDVNCYGNKASSFAEKKYTKNELKIIFEDYNYCKDGGASGAKVLEATASKKAAFKIAVLGNIGVSKSYIQDAKGVNNFSSNNRVTFQLGAEPSVLLPSGKLAFFLRMLYERHSAKQIMTSISKDRVSVDSYGIGSDIFTFSIGPRYNLPVGRRDVAFIDASFGLSLPSGSFDRNYNTTTDLGTVTVNESIKPKSDYFFNVGIGYEIDRRYGIDVRYDTERQLIPDGHPYSLSLKRFSIGIRYTIN